MALGLYELINNINKQIKGICCKIENLDPGGGGGVNIYNSDGTLTGNRTLDGANNDLTFSDLNVFKTSAVGNDIGLKLDFANGLYEFGTSDVKTEIDISQGFFNIFYNTNQSTFRTENVGSVYIGDIDSVQNGTSFWVADQNSIIYSKYSGNDIGLKLDFANSVYDFGDINNLCYIRADVNNTYLELVSGSNSQIQMNATNGETYIINNLVEIINPSYTLSLKLIDSQKIIQTVYQSNYTGFKLDFANSTYQFGQLTGGNTTYLTIDDAAAYPVQLTGTNISSGTAGAASGQFLKIKVGGVDYKIALLNP